jgi:hypothetical protein
MIGLLRLPLDGLLSTSGTTASTVCWKIREKESQMLMDSLMRCQKDFK